MWLLEWVAAPPHFRARPPDVQYVKVGESITLTCEADGSPNPTISWFKNGLPLDAASQLRIGSVRQADIGDYMCVARNREGSVSATAKVIVAGEYLVVYSSEKKSLKNVCDAGPAVIIVPPHNLTKLEGKQAELVCEARALPANITHHWFHNGVEITQLSWLDQRAMVRKDGSLYINPTHAEDSGLYSCEVSNGIGTPETASAYLSIEYPARVTYSPTIQYLPQGLSGIVRCYVQASPPFTRIAWTKDQRPFDPNSTPSVVTLNNGSLLFQRVSHEHQGRYRCEPHNDHGTAGPSNEMEVLVRGEWPVT
ncbi:IGSF9B [Cordylochernes scorpioides]|uniref:IGSF9B n=1 Tax=Cordylochernes scorpioides TaxID=51811 RepID=A0ABY6LUX3_9ARAC|nr:IGSF9B [Cordylochernes scorpioides]